MSARQDVDVEQLLGRTYAEVAARTTVDRAGGDVRVGTGVAYPPVSGGRWRPLLAAAAVVALVVGGLLVLAGRGEVTPAGRGVLRHVAPAWIPRVDAEGAGPVFPLTELVSTETYDRLGYAVDDASVTIEIFRDRFELPEGDPVVVRGVGGVRTGSAINWLGPDESVVAVSWTGAVPSDVIDQVVAGMIYLDDDQWAGLTEQGGFRAGDSIAIASFSIPADRRIGAAEEFDVELVGSIHDGVTVRNGPNGYLLPFDRCHLQIDWDVSRVSDQPEQPGRYGYLVLVRGTERSVPVFIDGTVMDLELTPLGPIVDISLGGFVLDDRLRSDDPPTAECEAGR